MSSSKIATQLRERFTARFGEAACMVRSPGRINLIGEHTDYNQGFVLPAAIDKAIYLAIRPRHDGMVNLFAADLDAAFKTPLSSLQRSEEGWPNYVLGVVDQLVKKGCKLGGMDIMLSGDVPLGAGLSSSAAVECATAFALNEVFGLKLEKVEMVKLAQRAENEFAGVQCGIMDQFASMMGRAEHLLRLDCRSLAYEYIPFRTDEIELLLLDTGVKHSLASSEYNLRRQQCEAGVAIIQGKYPEVQSLRDVTMEMLNVFRGQMDDVVYRRCEYVVEEKARLLAGCDDLTRNDLSAFGKKMFETHRGLSVLYEVSCAEADALVDLVQNNADVLGARMMGGGFGGCTINIVKKGKIPDLLRKITPAYEQQFKRELKYYQVSIDEGTSLIK
jgi:galactokinase